MPAKYKTMETFIVFTNTLPVLVTASSIEEARQVASQNYTVVGVVKQ